MNPLPAEIFKAYDIRGIVGKTLTPDLVEAIGHAIASEAAARRQSTIAIGRDGRLSGPELSERLARGILKSGIDVIDLGLVATPMLYFATHQLQTQSGVMVTGSHNPPDYNGLKMVLGGETLAGETIQALRVRLEKGELVNGSGSYRTHNIAAEYIDRIAGDIRLARPMKIVVDCGNGVPGAFAPALYRRLGCEVTEMFCEVDGNFPNHHPDPSVPKNLEDLIAKLRTGDAELGLAFDGDGDRLGVVAKDGQIIFPDRQLMLFAQDVLSRNPGAEIIFDVKSTRNLFPWIVGEGEARGALMRHIDALDLADRVSLAGARPQEELPLYYSAADALVLASSREGWPNVLLEAMACGTPVVVTRLPGTAEVVAEPAVGELVDERSGAGFAQGVRRLLQRAPETSAIRRYAERHSWHEATRGQLELFRRVLAARGAQPVSRAMIG